MPRSKTTTTRSHPKSRPRATGGQPAGAIQGHARRKKSGVLTQAAKAVGRFLTDPDYPRKTATKGSRHRGELIA